MITSVAITFGTCGNSSPVYVSNTLEKLAQWFIFQSLLVVFIPTPDESRLTQRNLELQAAAQRVVEGNKRVATAIKPWVSFFKPASKPYFNPQEHHQPRHRYFGE